MTNSINIDLKRISQNLEVIKQRLAKNVKLLAVVKANAYGHGLVEVAKEALKNGAFGLAAFGPDEGILLRQFGITEPIFLVGFTDKETTAEAVQKTLVLSVVSLSQAEEISAIAQELGMTALIDLKVETGMNRFGFEVADLIRDFSTIKELPNIKISGIHSHFADALNEEYSRHQISEMNKVLSELDFGDERPMIHMTATDSTFLYPEAHFDGVRIGIGMYGYCDSAELKKMLKPTLSLRTKIAQIKEIKQGESVSYRRTFIAGQEMRIAVLPIGYADGLPRALSNTGQVLISGQRANIIGRICMNVTIVDVSKIDCKEGDEVILMGESGNDKIDAADVAKLIGTNPHEILTGLSQTLPRVHI